VISLLAGVLFGPGARWIRPDEYALHSEENLEYINLYLCRMVLGVQLVIAGIQLPSKYLQKEWRSMAYLIGPGMVAVRMIPIRSCNPIFPDIKPWGYDIPISGVEVAHFN